ncbi:MAG: hypothetical protein KGH63_00970 [Candidatus Micrarchaeota archaeon]|nr:hypothetical protein [Candidatus Micrarchaeota archaeon]
MKAIYETTLDKKAALSAILEADPYGENEPEPYHHISFGRNGYKLKDGSQLDEDRNKTFVFIRGPDEFEKFCLLKFKDLATRAKPEDEARIIAKFEAEEGNAEMGMGAIFG